MRIAFFIGSVDISGGSYVIFQHALAAQAEGHDVTIVAQFPYHAGMLGWHPGCRLLRLVAIEDVGDARFDLAIATWWKTALELHRLQADRYAYFVQSIESRFYPEDEQPLRALVEATYDMPLPGVTEAAWIEQHLRTRHGRHFGLARNGIRKDLYRPDGPTAAPRLPEGRLRVLVEGPFGVPFKNVGRTLALVRQAQPDETWLLTATDVPWYPGVTRLCSRLPVEAVPAVYRACDAIVKLSYVEGMFGPPLEHFHCGGTAVVYAVTGHDEYIVPNRNALVCARDDEAGVVAAVRKLREDPGLLRGLKAGARETAEGWPDWEAASRHFWDELGERVAAGPAVTREDLAERAERAWAVYARDEQARLAARPGLGLRRRTAAVLDTLPRNLTLPLRMAKYIWAGRAQPLRAGLPAGPRDADGGALQRAKP